MNEPTYLYCSHLNEEHIEKGSDSVALGGETYIIICPGCLARIRYEFIMDFLTKLFEPAMKNFLWGRK